MPYFKYKHIDLFNPLLKAMKNLGGSGSNQEIENEVAKVLNLSEEEINDVHKGNVTKLSYRLAWARNNLKRFGLIENSERGVWSLTQKGTKTESVNKEQVLKELREKERKIKKPKKSTDGETDVIWNEELLTVVQNIPPDKFERLSQRMLRELGFINVEVTGRSGDGGIDGKGVLSIGGVLSFHVVFQCKRFKGSVSPSMVRDFRGAMIGRADKGLIITTGTFTAEARKEAQRDGAPPIDLMDGLQFTEKLKELKLGVETVMVEEVKIDNDWFNGL